MCIGRTSLWFSGEVSWKWERWVAVVNGSEGGVGSGHDLRTEGQVEDFWTQQRGLQC